MNGEAVLEKYMKGSLTGQTSRTILTLAHPVVPSRFREMLNDVQSVDIDLEDLAPDAPELVERGKDNVETGTTNVTDQLELLDDERN